MRFLFKLQLYLYQYDNLGGTSFDFQNPKQLDLVYNATDPINPGNQSLRSFKKQDLDGDGNPEFICYLTNQYSGLGSLDFQPTKLALIEPHNQVLVYTNTKGVLSNTTTKFIPDQKNLGKWFSNESGWQGTTHLDAQAFCESIRHGSGTLELCPLQAYCPNGPQNDKPL